MIAALGFQRDMQTEGLQQRGRPCAGRHDDLVGRQGPVVQPECHGIFLGMDSAHLGADERAPLSRDPFGQDRQQSLRIDAVPLIVNQDRGLIIRRDIGFDLAQFAGRNAL